MKLLRTRRYDLWEEVKEGKGTTSICLNFSGLTVMDTHIETYTVYSQHSRTNVQNTQCLEMSTVFSPVITDRHNSFGSSGGCGIDAILCNSGNRACEGSVSEDEQPLSCCTWKMKIVSGCTRGTMTEKKNILLNHVECLHHSNEQYEESILAFMTIPAVYCLRLNLVS